MHDQPGHSGIGHEGQTYHAATEQLREEILGVHASHATSPGETLFAMTVVQFPLFRVRQNLVRLRNHLELFSSSGVLQ